MPWIGGKNCRFCFASWGFVRKITTLRAEVTEFEKKRKTVRFLEGARPTSSPPDRQER